MRLKISQIFEGKTCARVFFTFNTFQYFAGFAAYCWKSIESKEEHEYEMELFKYWHYNRTMQQNHAILTVGKQATSNTFKV